MNASQLHGWVLKNLTPLQFESTQRQSDLMGGDTTNEYLMEAGRHQGLHEAGMLLLDLVREMFEQERADMIAEWERQDRLEAVTSPAYGDQ